MLKIMDVHKSFGPTEVLKGVSINVEKGDVITILGPSGSGKTTLLRCINFLEQADRGTMEFDGERLQLNAVKKKDKIRPRKKTAFVFQNYNLFRNKTALENVMEGLIIGRKMPKAEAISIGTQALDKVGLQARYNAYPHELSGGQQQRVGIARAIATQPEAVSYTHLDVYKRQAIVYRTGSAALAGEGHAKRTVPQTHGILRSAG